MIGLADNELGEVSQIEKSLAYGDAKLAQIRCCLEELKLLEADLLAVRGKLHRRLEDIRKGDPRCSTT
jgi:hypothetical protein